MFSRKREGKRRTNAGSGLSQFGLLDIPDVNNVDHDGGLDGGEDDDDDALEAELLALTSGNAPARPKRGRPAPPPQVDLDAMVAESLRDIPSDEDLSGDEDDPELLHELGNLEEDDSSPPEPKVPAPPPRPAPVQPKVSTGNALVTMLEERLKMYQEAEKNAKTAGESSRARRFGRGMKTLSDMIKQARAGRVVNEEDIPPPVVTSAIKKPSTSQEEPSETQDIPAPAIGISEPEPPAIPSRPAPPPPPSVHHFGVALPGLAGGQEDSGSSSASAAVDAVDRDTLNVLTTRRDAFKLAALQAKRSGDMNTAIQFVRISKQFDKVIAAVESGQPVDLSAMPPAPSVPSSSQISEPQKEENRQQAEANDEGSSSAVPQEEPEEDPSIFNAPPAPVSVMEALQQRLAKYQSCEQAAKEEGNASKARRMGRIVKQYEGAIKLHKSGKPIPLDDLPTPPGFGPIPVEGGPTAAPAPPPPSPRPAARVQPVTPVPSPRPTPSTPQTPATPLSPATPSTPGTPATPTMPSTRPFAEKANVRKSPQSRQEKQLTFLVARQKEFKEAALKAKQNGEINQAKEYLRLAKGFDPLIEASNCGLPVDMATVPVPPDTKVMLESDFDIINIEDCIPGSDAEIFEKLEEDLLNQAKMCLTTRDHFKAIGDVASANRFEQLALHSKQDLNAVRCAHRRSEPLPKFHYETRSFAIVQCNTELGDNDLELTLVQGINYNVSNPKDVDTYVRFEFPYPSETPYKDKTALIKDTNNPQYDQAFMIPIQRNVRACQRVFKRQNIKLEVWSRGGFLRSDTLIGTLNVKLTPLETKCTIHDSFDLMDGRRAVGGKLEVKVRLRNPILTKQVEQVQEKWLIIDGL